MSFTLFVFLLSRQSSNVPLGDRTSVDWRRDERNAHARTARYTHELQQGMDYILSKVGFPVPAADQCRSPLPPAFTLVSGIDLPLDPSSFFLFLFVPAHWPCRRKTVYILPPPDTLEFFVGHASFATPKNFGYTRFFWGAR